ncbi:HD-GYP domain-containing protein [Deinococcus sp. YIM 134068]|uniref:HD-GYP domain-containing protein n=1 Tax=Deinococcus lichenicola TaxID=3118910 RepID=UPI002F9250D6
MRWLSDGTLTLHADSPAEARAALAWLPDLTEPHLTRARLTGHARLPGSGVAGLRLPGLGRRAPSAALLADPDRPDELRLCWPAPAAPPVPVPATAPPVPAAIPPALLGWLGLPFAEALHAAAAWLARDGARVRVRLSDGVRLHTAHLAWRGEAGPGEQVSSSASVLRVPVLDGETLCGDVEWAAPGPQEDAGAAAQVLAHVARQARERHEAGHRVRAGRLAAELHRRLLALTTHEATPDAPLHAAMRLLGATGAALVTRGTGGAGSGEGGAGELNGPLTLGSLSGPGVGALLRASLLRRLPHSRDLTPYLLPVPDLAERGYLLVVPLRAAGETCGAWVFACPYRPLSPVPEGWAALQGAARHPALLASLAGGGPEAEGGRTPTSLLRSLGETDFPSTLAERGLSHLVGASGAQAGAYLTLRGGSDSGFRVGEISAVLEVGGQEVGGAEQRPAARHLPPDMVRRVAGGGEPLALTAPHPLLPAPLTSALLTPVRNAGRTSGVLALLDTRAGAQPAPETPGLLALLAERVGQAAERQTALWTLARTREQAFNVLGKVLEYRSYETKGHTDRVTRLALRLGTHLDLEYDDLAHLRWGAYLHDLGKIAIPDAVLLKRGPLTATERELMRGHATIGEFILREQGFVPPEVLAVVRHHHERWDGRGYPDGLQGEDIPFLARLFTVVDVYDALTSERPYKPSWTHEDALAELGRMSGRHLDPALLEAFLSLPEGPGEGRDEG